MTIVKILQFPNTRLRQKGKIVTDFGAHTQQMIDDMFETHYATANCAALACTQLDFQTPQHITVIDFSEQKNQPLCLVNAKITEKTGTDTSPEGCMSVHGAYENVTRAAKITVRAQDRFGAPLEFEAEGFMAKCIQHELDHLDGKLFLEHLSHLKRALIKKKIAKLGRHNAADDPAHVHGAHCHHD
jgi:peptide deformylase